MNSCGVTEEELAEQRLFAEQVAKRDLKQCKRCSAREPTILLQKKDAFCGVCYVEYASHKFRSTIGKSKQLKPSHRVLLAVSPGQSSQAMLNLTRDSLHSPISQNRLFFRPHMLYIDGTDL
jgi:cytoplasmic tRNA 2-thiolation protein 2